MEVDMDGSAHGGQRDAQGRFVPGYSGHPAGETVAARFVVGRLEPRPRSRTIELDLPDGAAARDIVAAYDVTVRAMAAGEITPDEALMVSRVLGGRLRALKVMARERKLVRAAPKTGP